MKSRLKIPFDEVKALPGTEKFEFLKYAAIALFIRFLLLPELS